MRTRREVFIVVVAALVVVLAGTAGAQRSAPPQRCKAGQAPQHFPATGQTTSFRAGDDGDIQAGATLSYTDNGDGTITDNNTCLVWEKKSDDGTIHDMANRYTWNDAFAVHVAGLNTIPCFAGHCDWRVPNVKELQSIMNYEFAHPSVSPAFNNMCAPGCDGLNCSCTAGLLYWSSSTDAFDTTFAWVVNFFRPAAPTSADFKSSPNVVRAVRGGSNLGSSQ